LTISAENDLYTNYITFYNIVVYYINMYNSLTRRGVLDKTLCDKVCQGIVACRWFLPQYYWNIVESGL
jgi:hypothetical protein